MYPDPFVLRSSSDPFVLPDDEQLAARVNAAGPRIELRLHFKRVPILRFLEYEDVAFALPLRGVTLQVFCDETIEKLSFHGSRSGDEAVEVMIDEMLRLSVLPVSGSNRESGLPQRRDVLIGELRKRRLLQRINRRVPLRQNHCKQRKKNDLEPEHEIP